MIDLLKAEFSRRLKEESLTRILKCIDLVSEDELWFSPNKNVNSIANLVLHLAGNITQYIQTTFAKKNDIRERNSEFSAHKSHSKEALKKIITKAINDAVECFDNTTTKELTNQYSVQCFQENGISIAIHVIEHCSYHVGQITQMTKWIKDIDTKYYGELKLD